MTLPKLTPEQRAKATEKALSVRRGRAELKKDLKSGRLTIENVFEGDYEIAKKMTVMQLLSSLPRVGKQTAAEHMAEVGIAPNRRVGGLGARQKRELLAKFGFTTKL